ncbi:aldolase/citrate lyase family protein [Asanoa sp. NPDC049573]|uniref:HpcH/HpaI aldolase/citrate lyase family protein n=1 Tax=Asanoa sp. NPDC049573 TaxID=3155396 RepID=UPI0034146C70
MRLTSLYVPGDRPDRFAKAVASGADAVILDLEDAVAPARKAAAREAVGVFLATAHEVPCEVRVATPADIPALAGLPGLAALRLPKVSSPADVTAAAALAPGTPLHVILETAVGVESAFAIATADPAVASIGLGEADLRSDLGVTDDAGLAWARGRVVVAARAAGLPPPAMSVHTDLSNLDELFATTVAGRRLGFLGRAAIHPRQLPVIEAAFRPAPAEVERARTLLAAVSETGGGALLPDGRFADRAMLDGARRVIALADRPTRM